MKRFIPGGVGMAVCLLLASCHNAVRKTNMVPPMVLLHAPPIGSIKGPVHTYPNGLTVGSTPPPTSETPPDPNGARIWRFDVTVPQGTAPVSCYVELHQQGKKDISWGIGAGIGSSTRYRVEVSMAPINSDIYAAQKLKFVTRITGFGGKSNSGGTSTNMAQDNLFKHRPVSLFAVPEVQPDGRWLLAGVRPSIPNSKGYDRAVFLRFKTGL